MLKKACPSFVQPFHHCMRLMNFVMNAVFTLIFSPPSKSLSNGHDFKNLSLNLKK